MKAYDLNKEERQTSLERDTITKETIAHMKMTRSRIWRDFELGMASAPRMPPMSHGSGHWRHNEPQVSIQEPQAPSQQATGLAKPARWRCAANAATITASCLERRRLLAR